jgi:hypothetical protein
MEPAIRAIRTWKSKHPTMPASPWPLSSNVRIMRSVTEATLFSETR